MTVYPIPHAGRLSEQCCEQVQQRDVSHCMRYLQEQQTGYGEEKLNVSSHYDQCCNELRMIRNKQCRCKGLQMGLERERQQGRMRPQDMRQMMSTAQSLPNKWGMRSPQCQFEMPSH